MDFFYVPTSKLDGDPKPALVLRDHVQSVVPLPSSSGRTGARIYLVGPVCVDTSWTVKEVGEALLGNLVLEF